MVWYWYFYGTSELCHKVLEMLDLYVGVVIGDRRVANLGADNTITFISVLVSIVPLVVIKL